jgi:hypothetical protein
MRRTHYTVPLAEFQQTLADIRRQAEQDRADRELRAQQASDEQWLTDAEQARRHRRELEYVI